MRNHQRQCSWNRWARWTLVCCGASVLAGCATVGSPPSNSDYYQAERVAWGQPRVGLALSGGGSKAAPFALGVIAGLEETGLLQHVDVISSVSGGSYAALYYYTRQYEEAHSDVDASPMPSKAFSDCLPLDRDAWFSCPTTSWNADNDPEGLCPGERPWRNLWMTGDPLRYASQMRANQDVLGRHASFEGTETKRHHLWVWSRFAGLVGFDSVVLAVPHNIANSLFDWGVPLSHNRYIYRRGIVRAYGAAPSVLNANNEQGRPDGDPRVPNTLTFDSIRQLYESGRATGESPDGAAPRRVPMWIVNATAGSSPDTCLNAGETRLTGDCNTFEFTPYGFGATAYGNYLWKGAPGVEPSDKVVDAVGASSAFFDSQQRTVGGPAGSHVINTAMHIANLEWGTTIPNFGLDKLTYARQRRLHSLLPWPLYLLHRHKGNPRAVAIRLSDGGMAENLGVASLLRRDIHQIIVVDAASDANYSMSDLCALNRQLMGVSRKAEARVIALDAIPDFQSYCLRPRDRTMTAPPGPQWWTKPILTGRVCAGTRGDCSDGTALATLYIVKPFLNPLQSITGGYSVSSAYPEKVRSMSIDHCVLSRNATPSRNGYPCEVVTYVATNGCNPFPQHSTVRMTALSSPYLFGAYRELGRYYAHALQWKGDKPSGGSLALDPGFWSAPSALGNTVEEKCQSSVVQHWSGTPSEVTSSQ